ncbi:unnamed protein product [Tilletia laevis]|nr:unnamed protein product [Tilletia laevis]
MTTNPPPRVSIADAVNPLVTAVPQMAEISTDETADSSHLTTLPEDRVAPPPSNLERQVANTNRLVESMLTKFDGLDRRLTTLETSLPSLSSPGVTPSVLAPTGAPATPTPAATTAATTQVNAAGFASNPRPGFVPPHLVPGATSSTPPRGVQVFRRLPTPTKKVFREVLGQLGSSVDKVIEGLTEADLEDSQPLLSTPDVEITVDHTVPSISVASNSSSSSRFRPCKPEYLPTYDGNPLELEKYLGRIGGILRTDPDEAWALANPLPPSTM